MTIQYIQPGKPSQNAVVEHFNKTCRNEVLDLYLFRNLNEVWEITYWWKLACNAQWPHDSIGDMTSAEYLSRKHWKLYFSTVNLTGKPTQRLRLWGGNRVFI